MFIRQISLRLNLIYAHNKYLLNDKLQRLKLQAFLFSFGCVINLGRTKHDSPAFLLNMVSER